MSIFESKVCSRCGGSGNFSFNHKDGTMCYGCNGTGSKLTKRGTAALKFFQDSLTIPASELAVGMRIKESVLSKKFVVIQNIHYGTDKELGKDFNTSYLLGPNGDKEMVLIDSGSSMVKFYPETRVRVFHTDEQKQEKLQIALDYQSSLNMNGMKRKTKLK